MALTPEQIIKTAHEAGLYQDGINTQLPLWVLTHQELERFARAIEAEVRKQDDALIRQLVEAMEGVKALNMGGELALWTAEFDRLLSAITAARARLGKKT